MSPLQTVTERVKQIGKDQVAHSSPLMEDDLVNDEDFMKEMENNMMDALRDADSDIQILHELINSFFLKCDINLSLTIHY